MKDAPFTLSAFQKKYPDNNACLDHLFKIRFPNSKCKECGKTGQFYKHPDRPCYACSCGRTQISPMNGTIFAHSSQDLKNWYIAIYLITQSRNGVSAMELTRHIPVSYKTAHRMFKLIRELMKDDPALMFGEVEADETMYGPRKKGKRGRGAAGKAIVFATAQRGGHIRTAIVPNVKAETLIPHFQDHVAKGTKLLTDEFRTYRTVAKVMDMEHKTVNHKSRQYAKDGVHVNTLESFFGLVKRSISGTYHVVSPRYLGSYVSEFQWRRNYAGQSLFDLLLCRADWRHV